jgi:hypothetical protein
MTPRLDAAADSSRARSAGRTFPYLGASIVFAALVFYVFAKPYYLGWWSGAPPLARLVQVHGAVMTGWVVLLVVQSGLIAARRTRWHRRLGAFGAAWALLVVILGSATTIHAAAREVRGHTEMETLQLTITGLELVQMLLFAVFVASAILLRRRVDHHKRLMLLTILCMLPSVIPRLPVGLFQSILSILLTVYTVLVVVIAVDTYRERRLHPAFAWGGGVFFAALQLAYLVTSTSAWQRALASVVT